MQLLMSFLETSPVVESVEAEVWPTLEARHKDEVVTALARLMAKAVDVEQVGDDAEVHDD